MFEYSWVDNQNLRNNHELIYHWWINDKKRYKDTLKSKWTHDLLDFEIFFNLADENVKNLIQRNFMSEKYIEKLVKMGKLFLKKQKREKRLKSNYVNFKLLRW